MLPTDLAIFSESISTIPCIHTRASGPPRAASVWAISFSWCGTRGPTAAMDLEVHPEDLLRHRGALDVPAGPASPQGEAQ